jgi:NitT/TauT family transport system substrate-binding protein
MSAIPRHRQRPLRVLVALASTTLAIAACGDDDHAGVSAAAAATSADGRVADGALEGTVRLGFFPNVTHAPALIGVGEGDLAASLGEGVQLETYTFNAGTEAIEALFTEAIDLTFIGPNPVINGFAQSDGDAVRIVAGSTSGGAYLVVKPEITSVDELAGRTLATPSLGNTQDVALRAWLADNGYETTPEGGGDVTILPQANASTLEAFASGAIDGAWVPEPWATRLVLEGGGSVLVDERDLWPQTGGEYVTTHLVVRTEFLEEHPELVRAVIEGLDTAIARIDDDPEAAQAVVIDQIEAITGQRPADEVVARSFANLTFSVDPIAASLAGSAADAVAVGLLDPVDLDGIYDLTVLNDVLAERGEPPVEAP